ncbi:thioredoxin family protein [Rubritalea tangerina]|uniref:Thioredoxin family protein n=1 Tax=Rubritalea tangerina TaxID=430798 RepID=A0ABW4Z9B6_9BACT
MITLVSCDQVESLVSEVVGEVGPSERRAGIKKVHSASVEDVKTWLAEPNVLVVLEFHSATSAGSLALSPRLDAMAERYADTAAIMRVEVGKPGDEATMAMNEYNVDETPTLKFFLNGEEVDELKGAKSESELDEIFARHTSGIDTALTLREGELPGTRSQRTVEDMMVRRKKGDLPSGITRVKVPEDARTLEGKSAANVLTQPAVPKEMQQVNKVKSGGG